MIRDIAKCNVCGFQTMYSGGCFSFLPMVCCEETRHLKRRIAHRRRTKALAGGEEKA